MEFHFYFVSVLQNSNWVLISLGEEGKKEKEKMFQAIFLIFKEFHFRSLKSTTISTFFINAGPIKCPHSVQCFGWLWHWFDFRPNFHFSFLMCMIKLSRIGPTQRADRSFFNIISCSFLLKKSFTPRMMLFIYWKKPKDSRVSDNNNTKSKYQGEWTKHFYGN